uniref:Canopy FGF signaling regulator 2 n=1 Tax=Acanthochromis polyacanthus TaxID=80966 RepID=A0A3Q1FD44_9TELE
MLDLCVFRRIMRKAALLLVSWVFACLLLSCCQAARQGQDVRCGGKRAACSSVAAVFVQSSVLTCLLLLSACRALVDEMEWAISQVDPKKMIQTGSFRINPDGSQSIREVPLARSEGNLLDLMESVCERMEDYGEQIDSSTSRKSYIRIKSRSGEAMDLSEASLDSRVTSSLKFACETIVEQHEDEIIEFFAHETDNVKDKLCSKRTGMFRLRMSSAHFCYVVSL